MIAITDVPPIIVGRGKNKQRVPDPDIKATEMYLFTYECKRTKRGVSRRRALRTLDATRGEVESQLMDFVLRDDVIVIENQDDPLKYLNSRAEPTPLAGVKGAV